MVKGNLVCDRCSKEFTSSTGLSLHIQLHTGQFRHYCEICRRGFNSTCNFQEHVRNHQGLKFNCKYCDRSLVNKKNYDYHQSVHTGQYRFTCNTCGKGFNVKQNYENHLQSHIQTAELQIWTYCALRWPFAVACFIYPLGCCCFVFFYESRMFMFLFLKRYVK